MLSFSVSIDYVFSGCFLSHCEWCKLASACLGQWWGGGEPCLLARRGYCFLAFWCVHVASLSAGPPWWSQIVISLLLWRDSADITKILISRFKLGDYPGWAWLNQSRVLWGELWLSQEREREKERKVEGILTPGCGQQPQPCPRGSTLLQSALPDGLPHRDGICLVGPYKCLKQVLVINLLCMCGCMPVETCVCRNR